MRRDSRRCSFDGFEVQIKRSSTSSNYCSFYIAPRQGNLLRSFIPEARAETYGDCPPKFEAEDGPCIRSPIFWGLLVLVVRESWGGGTTHASVTQIFRELLVLDVRESMYWLKKGLKEEFPVGEIEVFGSKKEKKGQKQTMYSLWPKEAIRKCHSKIWSKKFIFSVPQTQC